MQLDQILGLAARAIQAVVDPFGRADIEARDDEADVEAELGRLNTGDGAPFAIPGLCLVAGLGIAAQNSQVLDGASRADVVGDLVDFSGERLGTGQTEDVVDAVVLAPRHRLRPSIVPVATERNSRRVIPKLSLAVKPSPVPETKIDLGSPNRSERDQLPFPKLKWPCTEFDH